MGSKGSKGWFGPSEEVGRVLREFAVDRNIDGEPMVTGVGCIGFGGEEVLLDEGCQMRVNGEWVDVLPHLQGGLTGVTYF